MHELEVFFDYACPYCLKGHKDLTRVLADYPDVQVTWRPCESHPRPERYGSHSDLCIQGFFFAKEQGADVGTYHDLMYKAALVERVDIEDVEELARYVDGFLDADAYRQALEEGTYREALKEANQYAFGQSEVWVVPALRMGGRKLDSVEDVGITKNQIDSFLQKNTK